MQKSPDVASRGRSFVCISGSKENFSTFNLAFWRENNILLSFSIQETRDRNNEPQTSHAPFPQQQRQKANPNTSRVHYWLFRLLATRLYTRATLRIRCTLWIQILARGLKSFRPADPISRVRFPRTCVYVPFSSYTYTRGSALSFSQQACVYISFNFSFSRRVNVAFVPKHICRACTLAGGIASVGMCIHVHRHTREYWYVYVTCLRGSWYRWKSTKSILSRRSNR